MLGFVHHKLQKIGLVLATCSTLAACGGGSDRSAFSLPPIASNPPAGVEGPPTAPLVDAAVACNSFAGQLIDGGTITKATLMPADATTTEYCKLDGTLHATLNFEVHLPTEWNKKLVFSGGGGWDGSFFLVPLSVSANSGYVRVAHDGGNSGGNFFDASRFLNDPIRKQDFAYAATHTVLEAVKTIIQKRYSESLERSYFEGCSNGGREALISATRFPDDFDGIISRAPAYSFTKLMAGAFLENAKAVQKYGGWISPQKAKLVTDAVNAKCDALDGIKDGIISNAGACTFDPAELKCTGADVSSCLTDGEISAARTFYNEIRTADGTLVYPGWGPGGEGDGWPLWITGTTSPLTSSQFIFVDGLVKYWLASDPLFDTIQFDRTAAASTLSLAATLLDATPDLRDYFSKGKKLILAHGTNDWAISYKGSVEYFDYVGATTGKAARDANMEFVLLPGVGHCLGGSGPDTVDYLSAISNWVEKGKRPIEQGIIASKSDPASGTVQLTRPLCAYPSYPRYKGTGDSNAAENFECTTS